MKIVGGLACGWRTQLPPGLTSGCADVKKAEDAYAEFKKIEDTIKSLSFDPAQINAKLDEIGKLVDEATAS